MHKVIDCAFDISDHAAEIAAAGVETVIRYYNHRNSARLPSKRLEKDEARALCEAGLSLSVVFQQRGGAGGHIDDLDHESGLRDAERALELADRIGQPEGTAIYFAVDHDYWRTSELAAITPYFQAVHSRIAGRYRIGVYGSGKVGAHMCDAGLAELIWLAAAKGWSGTRDLLETDRWALYQIWPPKTWSNGAFSYDGNVVSTAWADFGQFRTDGASPRPKARPTVVARVIARSGLNLRRGPGQDYAVERALPEGTLVHLLAREGAWQQVDIEGDGLADGYMHGGYLKILSGGLPFVPPVTPALTPYSIAKAELAADIREVPGPGNNPRIVLYHGSTSAVAGTDDAVAWCSSFVNYCVESAGISGTDSQWALSWKDWGEDASGAPQEGDIVVFSRRNATTNGGHVGFFQRDLGDRIAVLGGNQSNRVRVTHYPKDGRLGAFEYKLKAIRRA